MSRAAVWIVIMSLLVGCTTTSVAPVAVRPDQLNFPELQFKFPQLDKNQLANGFKIYLKEDHELPLVELTLLIGGGSIQDPLEKTGLSQLFAAALETGGAGAASPADLEAELAAMAAELSVSSSSYGYQIDLSLHQRDLQRGLEILADLLRRPRFDADRLELSRSQLLEAIRRKNDDPEAIASRLLAEAVFSEHPFGLTPTQPAVKRITRDDLLQLQQRYLRPDNIWLAASGAFDRGDLLALMQQNFADWTTQPTAVLPLPALPTAPRGRVLLADKKIPQTSITMGHVGISKDNPDYFALQIGRAHV